MIQLIRGFKDILPGEVEVWQHIEAKARELFEDFGFKEIRIPIMEKTELFARSIGEDTDIVEKEMYTFEDRNGEDYDFCEHEPASLSGHVFKDANDNGVLEADEQFIEGVELLDDRLFFGPRRGVQGFFFGCLISHCCSPTSGS